MMVPVNEPSPDATDASVESVPARRAALVEQARALVTDRPELAQVVEQVAALDEAELPQHLAVLDAAHQLLRDALTPQGREGNERS